MQRLVAAPEPFEHVVYDIFGLVAAPEQGAGEAVEPVAQRYDPYVEFGLLEVPGRRTRGVKRNKYSEKNSGTLFFS